MSLSSMSYSSPDNVSTTTKLKQKAQQELQALTVRLSLSLSLSISLSLSRSSTRRRRRRRIFSLSRFCFLREKLLLLFCFCCWEFRISKSQLFFLKLSTSSSYVQERLSAFGEKAKRVLTRNKTSASEYHNLSESLLSQDEAAGNGGGGQQPIGGDYFAGGRQQQQQQRHSSPQIGSWSGMVQHHHQNASEHVPGMADIPSEVSCFLLLPDPSSFAY